MSIQIELILLVVSVLFFLSILAGKASSRFGVPALLLFLGVGMLCGSDGLGIQFEDNHIAQNIGTIALCIILFSGGLDTKISEIRPIIAQGVVLATLGGTFNCNYNRRDNLVGFRHDNGICRYWSFNFFAAGVNDGINRLGIGFLYSPFKRVTSKK